MSGYDLLFIALVLILIDLTAFPIYAVALSKKPSIALGFLVFLIVSSALNAFFTILTFGGAFGPGFLVFLSACLAIPMSAIFLLIGWPFFYRAVGKNYLRHSLYLGGGLIIVCLQFAPLYGDLGIGGACDKRTMQIGNQIVVELENYRQDNGEYPTELNALVPGYLSQLPTNKCLGSVGPEITFQLRECAQDGIALLTASSFDGWKVLRYNLSTSNWSGLDFLEGECGFLQ